jgi:tetraacyldisaccharide 4'-kinase
MMTLKSSFYSGMAAIYSFVTAQRNRCYDRGIFRSYQGQVPVISIGNITAGGNAKTPLCIFLANELKQRGYKPALLSRGYGGSLAGPYQVKTSDSPDYVGDEPLLLARHSGVPVVIARDRVSGARFIEQLGVADLIILDDGFQHRRLGRNIDIVSIDVGSKSAIDQFCRGALLPLGLFREDRDLALKRADMVVFSTRKPFSKTEIIDKDMFSLMPPGKAVFESYIDPEMPLRFDGAVKLESREAVAFCGIASPSAYFATLRKLGFDLVAEISYRDHHIFSVADIEQLRERYPKLPLICTEKDAVKLERLVADYDGIYYLPVKTLVQPKEEFFTELERLLTRNYSSH